MPDVDFSLFESDHMRLATRKNFRVWHDAPDALHEVAYIAPRLKAEQIELKQGVQEPLLLRKLGKNIVTAERECGGRKSMPKVFRRRPARGVSARRTSDDSRAPR